MFVYMQCVCMYLVKSIAHKTGSDGVVSNSGDLRSVKYHFIAITPRSTGSGVVVIVRVPSMSQIDLFKNDSIHMQKKSYETTMKSKTVYMNVIPKLQGIK